MAKNIVVCCDGTNNEIVGDQSNVLRLYQCLRHGEDQIAYYDAGVGTRADPTVLWPWSRYLHKQFDGAVGYSIRDNVLSAYRFLVDCYEPEDRIFLIGFSRGAYALRALAGMISRCGLLRREHAHLGPYVWSVYSDEDRSGDRERIFGGAARIREVFGRDVGIHFLGAWDTVSAFGWFWDQLTLPDTAANERIRHVRHAVALDEKRTNFRANHFQHVDGQDYRQVWFAGCHADVGGGYPEVTAGLARISFRWLLHEAIACGLKTDPEARNKVLSRIGDKKIDDELAQLRDESLRLGWRVFSCFPRRAFEGPTVGRRWRWPNFARRRFIQPKSLVHSSVKTRMEKATPKYLPYLPPDVIFVDDTPIQDP